MTICGTDLHILKGDAPSCQPATVPRHEGVGIGDAVGPGVSAFKPGDRVQTSGMTMLLQFVVSFGFILPVNAPQNMLAATVLLGIFALTYWSWMGYMTQAA